MSSKRIRRLVWRCREDPNSAGGLNPRQEPCDGAFDARTQGGDQVDRRYQRGGAGSPPAAGQDVPARRARVVRVLRFHRMPARVAWEPFRVSGCEAHIRRAIGRGHRSGRSHQHIVVAICRRTRAVGPFFQSPASFMSWTPISSHSWIGSAAEEAQPAELTAPALRVPMTTIVRCVLRHDDQMPDPGPDHVIAARASVLLLPAQVSNVVSGRRSPLGRIRTRRRRIGLREELRVAAISARHG
jgi:hypothetical protein